MNKDEIITGINGIRTLKDAQEVLSVAKRKVEIVANRSFGLKAKVQILPEHQRTRPFDEIGVVIKINPKKLKVKFPSGVWGVPKEMLILAN